MTILLIFIFNFKTLLSKKIQNNYIKSTLGINYLKIENKFFSQKFNFKKANENLTFSSSFKNFYFEYNFNNENFYTKFKYNNKNNKIELKGKNFNFLDFNSSLIFENIKLKISKYNLQVELFKKFNNFKGVFSLKRPALFNKKIKMLNKIYYLTDRYKILLTLSKFDKVALNINLKIDSFRFSIRNSLNNKDDTFSINSNFNFLFSYKIQSLKFYLRINKTLYLSLKATL